MRHWLVPWYGVDEQHVIDVLDAQLVREVGPGHLLYGASATAIGRRQDNDDCLFQLADGRVANVHLTWASRQEPDPRWPNTAIYADFDAFAVDMGRDHADWPDEDQT